MGVVFGYKEEGVKGGGGGGELHNGEPHGLYPLRSVIRVLRSEVITWVGHAARMTERKVAYRV
jgi:hypothetical protein